MNIRANKPTLHGPDHLPGGHDPIPAIPFNNKLAIITAETHVTGLADSTPLTVDFSVGTLKTNDGGLAWVGTPSDPFTGDYYSFDWGAHVDQIHIHAAGVYIIRYYWSILTFSGAWAFAGQNYFAMNTQGLIGDWGLANDSVNIGAVLAHANGGAPPDFDSEGWKVMDEKVIITTPGSPNATVSYSLEFEGQPGLTVSDSYAGVSIIRLGDIT